MTLTECMNKLADEGVTPSPTYKGMTTADDYVLAVNIAGAEGADNVNNYAVIQEYIEGVASALSAETNDRQFLRAGKSSTKKSVQRTFTVTGVRYEGDAAQDFLIGKAYSVGQDAITEYVYFNIRTGKGEKGQVTIVVNSDGGGNAGDDAAIDVLLNKVGPKPEAYTYEASTI